MGNISTLKKVYILDFHPQCIDYMQSYQFAVV